MSRLFMVTLSSLAFLVLAFIIQLTNRVAYKVLDKGAIIISGASTGIGRHAAEYLANHFSDYIIYAGVRNNDDAKSIENLGLRNLFPLMLDVTIEESCEMAIDRVKNELIEKNLTLVALVNNAGVASSSPIEFQSKVDTQFVFDTNVFGMLSLTQMSLPLLRESQGRIIQISSISGLVATPINGIYSASKFAMEGLSDSLRREVSQFGISVSVIQPGYINTPIFSKVLAKELSKDPELVKQMKSLYSKFYKTESMFKAKSRNSTDKRVGPDVVTNAIVHAITSRYPKIRYQVGYFLDIHTTILKWISWILPANQFDKMF